MEGLPKQFLSSLRILFDILDENRSGYVRLRDIESRWSDDGVRGLPAGVVDGLRKVTPANGLLSFDRFVSGLKLVLTKRRENDLVSNATRKPFSSKENRLPDQYSERNQARNDENAKLTDSKSLSFRTNKDLDTGQQRHHFISGNSGPPNQFEQNRHPSSPDNFHNHNQESQRKVPPYPGVGHKHTSSPVQRESTISAYAIRPDVSNYPNTVGIHQTAPKPHTHGNENPPVLPPRNDRASRMNKGGYMKKSHSGPELYPQSPPNLPPRENQHHVISDLKNWQQQWTAKQSGSAKPDHNSSGRDRIYANIDQFQGRPEEAAPLGATASNPQKATVRRHGSGRRHTLANGIDQNMLKRMKQMEEEGTILRSGLAMVETARDWYKKQLAAITDKQAMIDKVSYNDNSVEAHQERMNFQRTRIADVNQHLQTLVESSEKGFPLHMNLAMTNRAPDQKQGEDANLRVIKEQNRRLKEELNQKKDIIGQMEKDKNSLVRELFEARSKNKTNFDDTTFM